MSHTVFSSRPYESLHEVLLLEKSKSTSDLRQKSKQVWSSSDYAFSSLFPSEPPTELKPEKSYEVKSMESRSPRIVSGNSRPGSKFKVVKKPKSPLTPMVTQRLEDILASATHSIMNINSAGRNITSSDSKLINNASSIASGGYAVSNRTPRSFLPKDFDSSLSRVKITSDIKAQEKEISSIFENYNLLPPYRAPITSPITRSLRKSYSTSAIVSSSSVKDSSPLSTDSKERNTTSSAALNKKSHFSSPQFELNRANYTKNPTLFEPPTDYDMAKVLGSPISHSKPQKLDSDFSSPTNFASSSVRVNENLRQFSNSGIIYDISNEKANRSRTNQTVKSINFDFPEQSNTGPHIPAPAPKNLNLQYLQPSPSRKNIDLLPLSISHVAPSDFSNINNPYSSVFEDSVKQINSNYNDNFVQKSIAGVVPVTIHKKSPIVKSSPVRKPLKKIADLILSPPKNSDVTADIPRLGLNILEENSDINLKSTDLKSNPLPKITVSKVLRNLSESHASEILLSLSDGLVTPRDTIWDK